jgi:hypothetical protein
MFGQHEGGYEQEIAGGEDRGEAGECQCGEQEEGSGQGDGHHITEVVPAFFGSVEADESTLDRELTGDDQVFPVAVACGQYPFEGAGVDGEDVADDQGGEEEICYPVMPVVVKAWVYTLHMGHSAS